MYYSDPQRFRPVNLPASAGPQSTYDVLLSLRGRPVLLTLPQGQVAGKLEDVQPTGLTIGLNMPLESLPAGTLVTVEVVSGPGVVHFRSELIVGPSQVTAHIPVPKQVESVQRRQFSRVPLDIQIAFATASMGGAAQSGFGQTFDLSAGGMSFLTPSPLSAGQGLFLTFKTPDDQQYRAVPAIVLRAVGDGRGRYRVALRFDGLTVAVENSLVQTVFWLQVKGRGSVR
ncbi:MAG TPA: PilZ domain-containing protein [Symbiobacteriaceae bacterium]|nr:PilZ domain-containing protein [Symbiobacteriaceae bacterium]